MTTRIALFGGSFDPPGAHHRRIAEELARRFDRVVVVPCGPRPDKPGEAPAAHRGRMAEATFAGLDRVRVDLFDVEAGTFTRTVDLERRYAGEGEVWHVVGADLVAPGADRRSAIERDWVEGARLWREGRFAVVARPGFSVPPAARPPRHEWIEIDEPVSSSEIRARIRRGEPVAGLVAPAVAAYIARHGLYRSGRA